MGSSGSKRRKKSKPLPKVGSPANQRYQMRAERHDALGSGWVKWALGGLLLLVVVALLVLTL